MTRPVISLPGSYPHFLGTPGLRGVLKGGTVNRAERGLPVHSFRSLLADLATLARNTIITAITPNYPLTAVTRPTPIHQKALDLLGVGCSQ